MKSIAIRQRLTADVNRTIHITLPPEMGEEMEIIILPTGAEKTALSEASPDMAQLTDETGLARNVLAQLNALPSVVDAPCENSRRNQRKPS